MAINVNRANPDPFYRYKMPRLQAKVESRGNGIKTVIANMTEIAKALERPPAYPAKYFGYELGAQTNYDAKNERYIVNGDHDANKLQDILDGFIRKFVLCSNCENPETTLAVRKGQIHSKCKACGNMSVLDPKHKLSTYIVKNPPKGSEEKKENGNKEAADEEPAVVEEHKGSSSGGDEDDDDWAPELDESAAAALSAQVGRLVVTKDLELSIDERLDKLHTFFEERKKAGTIGNGKELVDEAERLDLKQKAPLLLANVLFDANVVKDGQVKTYRGVLLRFTVNDQKAQRYLLGGIEQLIEKNEAELLPKAAHILKNLYDADILEEEAILAWGAKPSHKYVSKALSKQILEKCDPVIQWLKEADEESEDEDEDNDDEVEFNERSRHVGQTVIEKPATNGVKNGEAPTVVKTEDGEEVDIDDI